MTDREIIDLFFDRSENAIYCAKEKYERYAETVCRNILDDNRDSEECVNDTFYTLWNKIPPEKPANLKLYIAKIARNISLTKYRYNNRLKRVPSENCEPIEDFEGFFSCPSDSENESDEAELSTAINRFIGSLAKKDRIIFVKRYYFNMRIEKIAEDVNLSARSVLSSLSKSKNKLFDLLNKEDLMK